MVVFVKGALASRPNPNALENLGAFDTARFADKLRSHAGRRANSTDTPVELKEPLSDVRFENETLQMDQDQKSETMV